MEKTDKNILAWLGDSRFDRYVGRRTCFKLAVLAAILSGNESLASVARRYGTTRQAAAKHSAAARKIFGDDNA